jgi:hypothetical protein
MPFLDSTTAFGGDHPTPELSCLQHFPVLDFPHSQWRSVRTFEGSQSKIQTFWLLRGILSSSLSDIGFGECVAHGRGV